MKKITGLDTGIILSAVGMLASFAVIVLNLIKGGDKTVGIILLCSCSSTFSLCARMKKNGK